MRNAHQHITLITQELFAAADKHLQKSIDRLHASNQEIQKAKFDGFMYRGRWFQASNSTASLGSKRVTIHLSLWGDMDDHLADEAKINLERDLIGQVLFRLIEPAESLQALREAIPECLAPLLCEEARSLPRGISEGYSYSLLPERVQRQYDKALPLMQFYASTRLIY